MACCYQNEVWHLAFGEDFEEDTIGETIDESFRGDLTLAENTVESTLEEDTLLYDAPRRKQKKSSKPQVLTEEDRVMEYFLGASDSEDESYRALSPSRRRKGKKKVDKPRTIWVNTSKRKPPQADRYATSNSNRGKVEGETESPTFQSVSKGHVPASLSQVPENSTTGGNGIEQRENNERKTSSKLSSADKPMVCAKDRHVTNESVIIPPLVRKERYATLDDMDDVDFVDKYAAVTATQSEYRTQRRTISRQVSRSRSRSPFVERPPRPPSKMDGGNGDRGYQSRPDKDAHDQRYTPETMAVTSSSKGTRMSASRKTIADISRRELELMSIGVINDARDSSPARFRSQHLKADDRFPMPVSSGSDSQMPHSSGNSTRQILNVGSLRL